MTYCDIADIDTSIPIITCLRASNGKEDHTVTIYNDWIFDGNFSNALPLNQKSLDICCSTNEENFTFEYMLHTYIMPLFPKYLKSPKLIDIQTVTKKKKKKKKIGM